MENDISEKNNLKIKNHSLIKNFIDEINDWEIEMSNYNIITNGYQ